MFHTGLAEKSRTRVFDEALSGQLMTGNVIHSGGFRFVHPGKRLQMRDSPVRAVVSPCGATLSLWHGGGSPMRWVPPLPGRPSLRLGHE